MQGGSQGPSSLSGGPAVLPTHPFHTHLYASSRPIRVYCVSSFTTL